MYEYHVMGAHHLHEVQAELNKRAKDGWRLVTAYQEERGGHLHFLFFERPKP